MTISTSTYFTLFCLIFAMVLVNPAFGEDPDSNITTVATTTTASIPTTIKPALGGTESVFCNRNLSPSGLNWALPQSRVIRNHWLHSYLIDQDAENNDPHKLYSQLACSYQLSYFNADLAPGKIPRIVFGPVIIVNENQEAIQFVVTSQTDITGANYYVAAFRGTNFLSKLDVKTDLDVTMVDYAEWLSSGNFVNCTSNSPFQKCVHGGYLKLFAQMLTIEDVVTYQGFTFKQFINNTISSKVSFSVTGHSLGAGIAQIMALYVLDLQIIQRVYNKALAGLTTFAGPAVFNSNLINYFYLISVVEQTVPSSFNITRIANPRDIVPLLFAPATTWKWKTIYQDWVSLNRVQNYSAGLKDSLFLTSLLVESKALSQQTFPAHLCADSTQTAFSSFNFLLIDGKVPNVLFITELGSQHGAVYDSLVYADSTLLNVGNCNVNPSGARQKSILELLQEALGLASVN